MSISRHALFGKLGATLFRSIESATAFSKLRGNPYVELVHWLHQLLAQPDSDLHRVLRHAGISRELLDRDMQAALDALPAGASALNDFSHHVEEAIERAWVLATLAFGDRRVRGGWLVAALVETPSLRRVLLSISPAFAKIPLDGLHDALPAWMDGSPEAADEPYDGSDFAPALPGEHAEAIASPRHGGSALDQYCTDLTARARAGGIDPVIGRELEIRTMIDVLLRRRQNNPLLTGDAGVGKTAVVEGLALAIAAGDVPPKLADVRLLGLDVGGLLAGASMKGEFEARLKSVLEGAAKSPAPVVLFVDEIHTLVGAGGQAGTGDAANLLKPALARGTIRTIGATTWAEYKRHIEKDPALTRRFQVLQVAEPDERAAIDMVRGLARTLARHHGVVVLDEALRAAVSLSHRYIPSRQLPDKAISLLDTACARVALSQHAPPRELQRVRQRLQAARVEAELLEDEARIGLGQDDTLAAATRCIAELETHAQSVEASWHAQAEVAGALMAARASGAEADTERASIDTLRDLEKALSSLQTDTPFVFPEVNEGIVAEIVSDWTGIPVGRMVTDEVTAVQTLPATLAARVIGQYDALVRIAERVQTARAGLADPRKPLGVFLLAGPSGVGKTETALALAEALYGGEQNLITINMSEYQEAHTVSGLKGAPPGYVGYGEGGVLTEAVRRSPYSVVLLDEIEKAHTDVHEMFYQVFDKGYMEDGDGRYIDFRNTTILLTSNVGAELTTSLCADDALAPDGDALRSAVQPELLKAFPAAFLGRVTVVPFRPLGQASLAHIVRLHLDRVVARMADTHRIELAYTPGVVDYIVARCLVQETGARVLIGFIEQHVTPSVARLWLDAFASKRALARIDIDVADPDAGPAGALVFRASEGAASAA
ncbi:type VI secretion system ATPase TssH [Paraburkholderia caballeronis]|uniref:Type VI secretion system protein VasG n=1 Tax=Paraburkholderia caballeronis TaxID=416943 RepID=A0A1H7FQ26_9BURK|nr:type VI secretion system ATPase TssH [Paraburkholderia caballeronis]PXW24953.1 type VI secretion system protein VasG [Paraburkholderia caballeronis]PXX00683.1 type VI secretion system protein VasG [Paraburkholderia caballeronis]RAJ98746.1 type VI secretion system protein VasG [Paraburkholderia caballeronis]SEE71566.1 type VI secretion system protein VasG [Paraburkholderia caballeronis]SEK26260.1 type VI secretion system protein VasG [Paraburkholderia caballeronis]